MTLTRAAPLELSAQRVLKASHTITGSTVRSPSPWTWRELTLSGLGPTLGALVASGFYVFMKAVHYW